jgi:hypothetical protein
MPAPPAVLPPSRALTALRPAPGIDLPASSWRWTVARWPHPRWVAWRRRAGELEPPGATAEMIRAAEWTAYQQLTRSEPQP